MHKYVTSIRLHRSPCNQIFVGKGVKESSNVDDVLPDTKKTLLAFTTEKQPLDLL